MAVTKCEDLERFLLHIYFSGSLIDSAIVKGIEDLCMSQYLPIYVQVTFLLKDHPKKTGVKNQMNLERLNSTLKACSLARYPFTICLLY